MSILPAEIFNGKSYVLSQDVAELEAHLRSALAEKEKELAEKSNTILALKMDVDLRDTSIAQMERENAALESALAQAQEALDAYLKAQCRMLEGWAEGDESVKKSLWKNLHACEEKGRNALSSLPSAESTKVGPEEPRQGEELRPEDVAECFRAACERAIPTTHPDFDELVRQVVVAHKALRAGGK